MKAFFDWLLSFFKSSETINDKILKIARAELGVKETRGGETARIIEYHASTTGKFDEDEVPWCASFICWVMDRAGLPSTKSALAKSYVNWGVKVDPIQSAIPGDVIVRTRTGGNHVHILNSPIVGNTYQAIGGNQGDAVTIATYPIVGVIAVRRALVESKTFSTGFPSQTWADYALKMVKASKLPKAVVADSWFKNKPENWVHLLSAMCKYESGYNPNATYKEGFKNSKGENVISTGLFQLSYESVGGYGFKVTTDQLKEPFKNIEIAIKILEKWVLIDGCISSMSNKGGARYWSVLRPSGKLEQVKALYKSWAG